MVIYSIKGTENEQLNGAMCQNNTTTLLGYIMQYSHTYNACEYLLWLYYHESHSHIQWMWCIHLNPTVNRE